MGDASAHLPCMQAVARCSTGDAPSLEPSQCAFSKAISNTLPPRLVCKSWKLSQDARSTHTGSIHETLPTFRDKWWPSVQPAPTRRLLEGWTAVNEPHPLGVPRSVLWDLHAGHADRGTSLMGLHQALGFFAVGLAEHMLRTDKLIPPASAIFILSSVDACVN